MIDHRGPQVEKYYQERVSDNQEITKLGKEVAAVLISLTKPRPGMSDQTREFARYGGITYEDLQLWPPNKAKDGLHKMRTDGRSRVGN